MRDLQHLEELSSTAALGLWADDVVLALDKAVAGSDLPAPQAEVLETAAAVLEAALQRTEHPLSAPTSAHALAATDSALSVVATLAREQPETSATDLLSTMADVLREAATGALATDAMERIKPVLDLFGMVGEHQLVASNSLLSSRKEGRGWTGASAISSSF